MLPPPQKYPSKSHPPALFVVAILSAAPAVSEQQVAENDVSVRLADLRITLPSKPEKDTVKVGGEDGEEPSWQHRLLVHDRNGSIIVWFQDSPNATDPQLALKAAQETVVRRAGGDVTEEYAIESDDNPGRHFIVAIHANDGEFRVAYYFFAGRFYQIMAVGTAEFTRSDAVNKMFASVRFGEEQEDSAAAGAPGRE